MLISLRKKAIFAHKYRLWLLSSYETFEINELIIDFPKCYVNDFKYSGLLALVGTACIFFSKYFWMDFILSKT